MTLNTAYAMWMTCPKTLPKAGRRAVKRPAFSFGLLLCSKNSSGFHSRRLLPYPFSPSNAHPRAWSAISTLTTLLLGNCSYFASKLFGKVTIPAYLPVIIPLWILLFMHYLTTLRTCWLLYL